MYNLLIIDEHKNACKRLKKRIKAYLDNEYYLSNVELVRNISKAIYNQKYDKELQTPYSGDFARELDLSLCGDFSFNRAKQINHNRGEKITRFKTKITKMINVMYGFKLTSFFCYFITLTFSDNTLLISSEATRRQYVHRFLNKTLNSIYYLANIDYGDEHEREHYHAIILIRIEDFKANTYTNEHNKKSFTEWDKYGFSNIKWCYGGEQNLAKYVNKLSNHRFKKDLENHRAIFPKSEKELNKLYRQVKYWQDGFELFDGQLTVI